MADDSLKCAEKMYAIGMAASSFLVKLYVVVLAISGSNGVDNVCPAETTNQLFSWPASGSSTCSKSDPIYTNVAMEIAMRCCDAEGNWGDPPPHRYIQQKIENPCPDDFEWSQNICIIVIPNSTYPPQCPYEETVPFFEYLTNVWPEVFPIWMPVVRNVGKYGLGLMHWLEPSSEYWTPFMSCGNSTCNNYHVFGNIKGKNCLIYYNSSYTEAVYCDEKHNAVCAYRSLPDRGRSFCSQVYPSCVQSDYSTRSKCFCKSSADQESTKPGAEFLHPYQNLVYSSSLSDQTCSIGLEKQRDGNYVWSSSNLTIQYTNWAEDTIFGDNYLYGAIHNTEWTLRTAKYNGCALYQTEVPTEVGQITLEYDELLNKFTVKLTDPTTWVFIEDRSVPLLFCFTDASRYTLVHRLEASELLQMDNATFKFLPHVDGPGTYWCEAFFYPDVIAKRSNKILLNYTNSEEYVVLLKIKYVKGSNPLTEAFTTFLQVNLNAQIALLPQIAEFYPRIFKIVDIDEENYQITVNFHVINPFASKPLKLYSVLRGYMEQNLTDFIFINVFGVNSCVGIQTGTAPNTVTWPVTDIHDVATKPREGYCTKADGSIMYRYCNGNYIDGAQWSDLAEPCTIQQSTNITVNLTNIVQLNRPKDYIQQVVSIVSNSHSDLVPLDIHLLSLFLEQIAATDEVDLNTIATIINSLMDAPKKILQASQNLFNATDRILHYTDMILENNLFIGEIIAENFIIVSYDLAECNLSGIVVSNDDELYNIKKIYSAYSLEEIGKIDNLAGAFIVSEKLFSQIYQANNSGQLRIVLTLFKNHNLFNEKAISSITTSLIIGALFPNFSEPLSGNIFTVYNILNGSFDCSYWNYDVGTKSGYWQSEDSRILGDSFVICSYDHLTYFALAQKTEVNVTLELQNIINSNVGLHEKLESASLLTKHFLKKFEAIDVRLIAQLLYEVVNSQEDHLELVCDILDRIVDISPEILENAQMTYNATGKILIYFEQILERTEESRLIRRDNFNVIVQLLKEEEIYGFVLENCNINCNLTLFYKETSEKEITTKQNLGTALIFDKELLQQLVEAQGGNCQPKIVITIFNSQALFIEDHKTTEVTTKVVGVFLPGFDDSLKGGINLLYSIDMNVTSNYTCSVYSNDLDASTSEKGFWNTENPPKSINNFMECQFWNPKYFALLQSLINFTSTLEFMLDSDDSIGNVLHNTHLIVSKYNTYLKSVDIFIVAKILSKVKEVDEVVLTLCVRIVSYTMYISSGVLLDAQETYQATDMILYHLNRIAASYNFTKEVYEDNIALIVSLLSETELYGLGLNYSSRSNVTLLYKDDSVNLTQFDAAMKINPNLLQRLFDAEKDNYVAKLVTTIFYNNVLFPDESTVKNASEIFGIYFPNYSDILAREFKLYFQSYANDVKTNYSCFAWHYQSNEHADIIKGFWDYNSNARDEEMLTCNFYSSGFFTLAEGGHPYDNMSKTLSTISTANISFSEKLYKLEDTSYFYWEYLPTDVALLSFIFSQCDGLDDDELERVNIIMNNILRISKSILVQSDKNYNALRHILQNLNVMASFTSSHQYSTIRNQFGLVVCQLNSSNSVGVIVTENDVSCFMNVTDETFSGGGDTIAGLTLSEEVLSQTRSSHKTSKIIVTILLNDVFFRDHGSRNTSVVLGIYFPNFVEKLQGDIVALFNSNVYNAPSYECAYWNWNDTSSWNTGGYKMGTGSFTKCSFRQAAYLALVDNVDNSTMLTELLKEILNDNCSSSKKLNQTQHVIASYLEIFEPIHVYYILSILSHVQEVDYEDLRVTAVIASHLMRIPRDILVDSQEIYNATDWILYHVDRIAGIYGTDTEIYTEYLAIIITNDIVGVAVSNCNVSCNVTILQHGDTLDDHENLNTALLIDEGLQLQINDSSAHLVVTIYFNDALFNEGYNSSYKNIGQIIGVIIPPLEYQMKGSLNLYYYTDIDTTEVCAFWNYSVKQNTILRGHWEKDTTPLQPSQISLCVSKHATHFALLKAEKNVTNDLEYILNSNLSVKEKLAEVAIIATSVPDKLSPVDIYLIAQILNYALDEVSSEEMFLTSHIISRLFYVPRTVLRESQVTYCATDRILHTIDEMAKLMDKIDGQPIVQDNFVVAVFDLKATNISGLMLEHCGTVKCKISTLENSVNLTRLAENEYLETAIALSDTLLHQIQQSEGSPKLVTTIFFSDVLFNEEDEREQNISMICGLLLPGLNMSLSGSIYLMYNTPYSADYNDSCAFWNYNVSDDEEIVRGSWKQDTEPKTKERFTLCEFDHTTHFALLLANDNASYADANRYNILDIMTDVTCLLSIIGIFGILLTAVLFERWRKNTGNQILINFVIAISIKIVMLYVSVVIYKTHVADAGCCVAGAILHYAILSEFCWMLIIAILQFKRFVEVLGGPPKYILLKACICGWVFPLLPVTLILIIDGDNYSEGQVGLCYPSGLGLYLGIWLPLIIIVSINFVIFIFIIYNVFHKKTETRDLVNHEILFQWRLALLLFSMLGLTWSFGFLAQISGAEVFVYLFCFTSTLQGFIMFLFFIVFNQSTRFLYAQSIKLWLYAKGYKIS